MAGAQVYTWPNAITLFRLLLLVPVAILLGQRQEALAMGMFTIAWLLDGIDGYLARRLKQATPFGFIFDKVVDRTLIIGTTLLLIALQYLPPFTVLLLTKDGIALPAFLLQLWRRQPIADLGLLGKYFMFVQGAALLWLMFIRAYGGPLVLIIGVLGVAIGIKYLYRVAASPRA